MYLYLLFHFYLRSFVLILYYPKIRNSGNFRFQESVTKTEKKLTFMQNPLNAEISNLPSDLHYIRVNKLNFPGTLSLTRGT